MNIVRITNEYKNNSSEVQSYELYVGTNENNIVFRKTGIISYKDNDITYKFIELVGSGFFDSLIDKKEEN